jgi:tRNA (guanine37-N1)-methyltransferase
MKIREVLSKKLTKSQVRLIPSSFEVIGDILIFSDFPKEICMKEKTVGEEILRNFRNIRVVCRKTGKFGGTFRTPKLKIMAGERRKETVHKENGVRVRLHVENVYFSSRLGHERERINKLVKKLETILVMFSGCAIYPINISVNTEAKRIYGVEINPIAHNYGLQNLKLNKVSNIRLFNGDVRKVLPKMSEKFDRILMPLPKSSEDFLDLAFTKCKKGTILHVYDFCHENEFQLSRQNIKSVCKHSNKKCKIQKIVKCGQYGPGKYRICIDVKII